ncbi:MAG: flagellar hook-basal body complex protein FliE [Pseudomonadota bacterium]
MNEINTDQLLNQIRTLGAELRPNSAAPTAPAGEFGQMLKTSLDAVNSAQSHSRELKVGFERGTSDASLAEVMIAAQKADLSFRAVTEVRNKLVQAYQDIMNMPV